VLYTFGSFGSPPEAYWDLCLKKEPESDLIFLLLGTGGTVEDLLELCLLACFLSFHSCCIQLQELAAAQEYGELLLIDSGYGKNVSCIF
jgi:hypothetical protein